jgi:two-component system chemotaxis sensor kinase CheA
MENEYADVFKEETYEILEDLEKSLLALEKSPDDADLTAKVFRAIHTIKGSGAMFGFDVISAFAHEIENAFEMVREGALKADKPLIDLTLSARDFIKNALGGEPLSPEAEDQKEKIIADLKVITAAASPASTVPPEPEPKTEPRPETVKPPETTYRVRFIPSPDIMEKGADLTNLLEELYGLGTCHAVAHYAGIPAIEDIDPKRCYVSWDIILTTTYSKNFIRDVFIFVENNSVIKIDMIDSSEIQEPQDYKKVGNILLEKGEIDPDKLNEAVKKKKKVGEILVEEGIVQHEDIESALVEQHHVREVRKKRQETEVAASLRVSSEKVDLMVNLVGELVTLQARLSQMSRSKKDAELISLSEEVERITWDLRENSMDMRMLPIGSTFSRFKRLVRDLADKMGKEVELTTEGGDTELDKTVIEKLNDPLVHIIRNSIDHGIETPEIRRKAGKPTAGNIHLRAFHAGYNVVIRITDDGAGMDTERIKKKAVERGIISPDKEMQDTEIFRLIFEPGFSTAKEVSDVSGRGVGMDVVKRNIEALRGFIDIDSLPGAGTTITLKIPLTLAIIDGLLVKIGTESFVIPLSLVESCLEIPHSVITASGSRQYINVRGELIPYIYLRDEFEIDSEKSEIEEMVIATVGKMRVGFVVDHIIGDHQTVIKSLGRVYKNVEGISGATILGDGSVALILDIAKLIQNAKTDDEKQE